jgi:alpha-glucosidase (family GH31 glycosyl hydrolase)
MKRRFRNFEFDENRFPVDRMLSFVDRLHAAGQHWVPIVDAGTAAQAGSPAFEEGNSLEVWVRDYQGGYYLSQVGDLLGMTAAAANSNAVIQCRCHLVSQHGHLQCALQPCLADCVCVC